MSTAACGAVAVGLQRDLGALLGAERQHARACCGPARVSCRRVRIVTSTGCFAASATNSAAGRACSPLGGADEDCSGGHSDSSAHGFDRHLDRFAARHDAEGVEDAVERQAVGDEVGDRHGAGGDESSASLLCAGLEPLAPTIVSSR